MITLRAGPGPSPRCGTILLSRRLHHAGLPVDTSSPRGDRRDPRSSTYSDGCRPSGVIAPRDTPVNSPVSSSRASPSHAPQHRNLVAVAIVAQAEAAGADHEILGADVQRSDEVESAWAPRLLAREAGVRRPTAAKVPAAAPRTRQTVSMRRRAGVATPRQCFA